MHGRLAAFLAAGASFFSPLWLSVPDRVAAVLTGAFLVGFAVLVVLHRRAGERLRWYGTLRTVADEADARRRRQWDLLPLDGALPPHASHPYGQDLDLFGRGSLLHLLYVAGTALGLETLRRWLLELPPRETTLGRQNAVRELGRAADLRMQLAASGRLAGDLKLQMLSSFEEWAESSPQLLQSTWLVWTSRAIPLATLVLLILQLTGVVSAPLWSIPLVVGVVVAVLTARRTSAVIRRASLGPGAVSHLVGSFGLVANASFDAPVLLNIQARVRAGGGAPRQIRRLEAINRLGEVRYSELLHLVLQGLCLWDLHVAVLLERWRRTSAPYVHSWFTALGEIEALCCLAELADGHPGWVFPVVREGAQPKIVAKELAHPLLPPDRAVANDIRIDARRVLFVTGSNMSGKSTLLRAVGVNALLARVGGPVSATSMELTTSEIFTYVHVKDSLLDGVSTFMAGLLRLKALVERARAVAGNSGTLLFLLDEPLQGTNPAERQLAIRRVLRCLLGAGASGAITSHDLALMEPDDLWRSATAVHFDERLDPDATGRRLVFDYRLRPGVCSSSNALRLLDAIGFPQDG
jgi:hypothetical protein